jgi:hypothetical protein
MPRGRCQGLYGAALVWPRVGPGILATPLPDWAPISGCMVERTLRLLFTLLTHTIPYLMTLRVMISQLLFITTFFLPVAETRKSNVEELPEVPLLRRYFVLLRQHSSGVFSTCRVQARRSFGRRGAHILLFTILSIGISSSL